MYVDVRTGLSVFTDMVRVFSRFTILSNPLGSFPPVCGLLCIFDLVIGSSMPLPAISKSYQNVGKSNPEVKFQSDRVTFNVIVFKYHEACLPTAKVGLGKLR